MPLFNTDSPLTSCKKIRQIQRTDFEKSQKNPIFGQIWAKICRIRFFFSKIGLRYFLGLMGFRAYLPSCKNSEKTSDPVLRKAVDKEKTDKRTHAQTQVNL